MDVIARNLTTVALARASFQCKDLHQAEEQLGLQDLAGMLASSKPLQDAWQRGRFLRELSDLAESPLCQAAVAKRLGFDEAGFKAILATDPEAADIWRQGRHRFFIRAKTAILLGAEQGKAHCLRTIEAIARAESGGSAPGTAFDHNRLPMGEMERITGISRVQFARWVEHGLPRDPDGNFRLPQFIAWLRRAPVGRARRYCQQPGAVEKRIAARVAAIVSEELDRESR
jgi:hypothetical protein